MRRERDARAGRLAAGITFPMMTDFAALNEFGGDRGDHRVAAMRTTRGIGESSDSGELRPIFMKLHVTPSLLFPSSAVSIPASWRGRDALMKVWWPKRQTFATQANEWRRVLRSNHNCLSLGVVNE